MNQTFRVTPNTYLVEFRTTDADLQGAGMARAVALAASRLTAGGTALQWLWSAAVPERSSWICLIAAADSADVVHALDVASLPAARVTRVVPLSEDGSPYDPPPTSDES